MLLSRFLRAARAAVAVSAAVWPAIALSVAAPSQTSYAYEGFDYGVSGTTPLLDGKDGGTGWASPWIGVNQPTGLVSFWPLDHTAGDAGPAGAHGTLGGAATFSTDVPPGLFWSGASLELPQVAAAQRGFIDLTPHIAEFADLNKGSITMWVKTSNAIGTGAVISVSNSTASGLTDFGVRVSNGKVQWGSRGQLYAGGGTITSRTPVNDGFWHHIAVTVDGATNTNLYIDGVLDTTGQTGFFGSVQGIDRMSIGRTAPSGGNQQSFMGLIDELAIWGSPLSPDDVRRLAGSRPRRSRCPVSIPRSRAGATAPPATASPTPRAIARDASWRRPWTFEGTPPTT